MSNGYFPGKKKVKRSGIITPRTAQETQIAAMPRMSREARQALRDAPPLNVGGADLVEGADRIMRTPTEHQAAGVAFKVARIYLRVSTDEQDLTRQAAIVESTRAAGFYVARIYREKASGARADRAELLRMIGDLLLSGDTPRATKYDLAESARRSARSSSAALGRSVLVRPLRAERLQAEALRQRWAGRAVPFNDAEPLPSID